MFKTRQGSWAWVLSPVLSQGLSAGLNVYCVSGQAKSPQCSKSGTDPRCGEGWDPTISKTRNPGFWRGRSNSVSKKDQTHDAGAGGGVLTLTRPKIQDGGTP